jgi:glycopeptide antibiotics resistance protein
MQYKAIMFFVLIAIEWIICRWILGRQRFNTSIFALAAYGTFILFDTVVLRPFNPDVRIELTPLWSYTRGYDLEGHSVVPQIIMNVIMYIPIGIILRKRTGWKGVFIGVFFSCVVETVQLISKRGLFEFDDIFHNALGVLLGFVVCEVVLRIKKGKTMRRVEQ